jgi:hypothetical protein
LEELGQTTLNDRAGLRLQLGGVASINYPSEPNGFREI